MQALNGLPEGSIKRAMLIFHFEDITQKRVSRSIVVAHRHRLPSRYPPEVAAYPGLISLLLVMQQFTIFLVTEADHYHFAAHFFCLLSHGENCLRRVSGSGLNFDPVRQENILLRLFLSDLYS